MGSSYNGYYDSFASYSSEFDSLWVHNADIAQRFSVPVCQSGDVSSILVICTMQQWCLVANMSDFQSEVEGSSPFYCTKLDMVELVTFLHWKQGIGSSSLSIQTLSEYLLTVSFWSPKPRMWVRFLLLLQGKWEDCSDGGWAPDCKSGTLETLGVRPPLLPQNFQGYSSVS